LNPSEKYKSQLGFLFPIYGKIKHVPNHQPNEEFLNVGNGWVGNGVAGMINLLVMKWIIPENSLRLAPVSLLTKNEDLTNEQWDLRSQKYIKKYGIWRHETFGRN